MNKAVVGVGGIGRRHAQSLLKELSADDILYAVDPSQSAKNLLENELSVEQLGKVVFLDDVRDLPSKINFLVVACNSKNRLRVIDEIVQNKKVENFLLEKVLFPTIDEYWQAAYLIKKNQGHVYINHPRRLYPVNLALKKLLVGKDFELEILGGDWGLLCNALHFIDLCQFFAEEASLTISHFELNKVFQSKRQGYSEAFGHISGTSGQGRFNLKSVEGFEGSLQIQVKTKDFQITIQEAHQTINIHTNGLNQEKYDFLKEKRLSLYQSELTAQVCNDIINGSKIALPSYDFSATSHLIFLSALENALKKIGVNSANINIT